MKSKSLVLFLSAVLALSSCKDKDESQPVVEVENTVSTDITTNTTWKADKIYNLKGIVHVTSGATLTIEPGTLIKGDKATKACLVISRGGKIIADGTAEKPIVFTSAQPVGARDKGDWGGIILLGKAPVNQGVDVPIEGIPADDNGKYGGTDAADNSGILRYVRIEFAGVALTPDNEINGLTFGGVGSGTTVDYVEVYRSGDDGFEWFGGTVNAKHLLSIGSFDDDFDTDFGFSGKIQFALAQRYLGLADVSGSNGFESDNDAAGSAKTPQTSPVFSNVTILGPFSAANTSNVSANFANAAQIRRSSALSVVNSVFAGYADGIFYDDATIVAGAAKTSENLFTGKAIFQNNVVYGVKTSANIIKGTGTAAPTVAAFLQDAAYGNSFDAAKFADFLMTDAYKYPTDIIAATTGKQGIPNFTVKAGSVTETGASFTNAKVTDSFFEKVAFRGAFGSSNWAAGWASFDPQNLAYAAPGAVK